MSQEIRKLQLVDELHAHYDRCARAQRHRLCYCMYARLLKCLPTVQMLNEYIYVGLSNYGKSFHHQTQGDSAASDHKC